MSIIRNIPTDEIIRLYTIEHLTGKELAKRFNLAQATIFKTLHNNNIAVRQTFHRSYHNIGSRTINLDINELKQLYSINHLPCTEIAKHFGVSFTKILSCLHENNIPVVGKYDRQYDKDIICETDLPLIIHNLKRIKSKTTGEVTCPICNKTRRLTLNRTRMKDIVASNGRCNRCAMASRLTPLDIEAIEHLYITERMTTKQISKRLNVSNSVIRLRVNQLNITRKKGIIRILHPNNKGTIDNPELDDIRKGTEIGLNNQAYYKWVTCIKCGGLRWEAKSRVNSNLLCKPCAMIRLGLEHRGENASCWYGGISFEPYGISFNNDIREYIRNRDNHTCQVCRIPENGKKLATHHIDYNKRHNVSDNLISLCSNCHSKTNHNRPFWTDFFNKLLLERHLKDTIDIKQLEMNLISVS